MKQQTLKTVIALILAVSVLAGCQGSSQPEATVVRVATDASWPPFESVNEAGEITGFDIDLMKKIGERAGFTPEFINVTWDPLLLGMEQCQYDAAISSMTITEERAKLFLFSSPYFAAGQIVTVNANNTDITGFESLATKRVGYQNDTTGAEKANNDLPNADLRGYDDISLAFQDLMNGQIDAVIADNPLALDYVRLNPEQLKTVGDVLTDEYYGIAVCNQKPELKDRIDTALASLIDDGTVDALMQQYFSNR